MAKSYFGKYESELEAQMALDQGKLLAPFVAMWNDEVHYNDLEETPDGEIGTEAYTGVPATGFTDNTYITAGSLYWLVADTPEWVSVSSKKGYGDSSLDVTIGENSETSIRNGSFVVKFFYDSNREYLKNEITVTIEQEAAEAPSTGATVTLSNSTLDSYQSWQYLQVSDASDLYWVANPPEWIDNGEPYYSAGDNAWWFEVEGNPLQEREGTFVVSFFSDDNYQTWLYDKEVSLTQEGQNSYAPSFNADFYVGKINAASGSGTTEVYILDNPGYAWSIEVDNFYNSGTSAYTAVTIDYEANDNYDASDKTVTANFYEDDTLQILVDTKSLTIHQEGNPDALNAYWESSSEFPSQGGSQNFFVQFSNPDVAQYAFSLTNGGGHFNSAAGATAFTASSSSVEVTGVTFFADVNTGSTFYGGVYIEAYDGSGQTLGNYTLEFSIAEVQPEVIAECTFITTSDNQTVNVPSYDGGNWMNAYIDNDPSNVLPMSESTYTFPSAGTHTITYVRESSDTYLQGWLQNNDMVECSLSCSTEWGMHNGSVGYTFSGCTSLTAVTLDEHCVRVGETAFDGCTALVLINCENPNQPTTYGAFNTITSNTGTLHIPSGADYTTFATDLGNNWTVVDDL